MMNGQPVLYAILRDLEHWDERAVTSGLEKRRDGALALKGASGTLSAGPFDAGQLGAWQRAHVQVDLPADNASARCELRIFTSASASAVPDLDNPDCLARALDTLLPPQRYLWLRVSMYSDESLQSGPLLQQVQIQTAGKNYIQHLPAVYQREDAPDGFLERWLAQFQAELGDLELTQAQMPGRFDPFSAPQDGLGWLASWLAFNPPERVDNEHLRRILRHAHEINDRRGTPLGLHEMITLYCGAHPVILESFHERHIWQLGYTSRLGFDTGLAAALPDGMIVPGHTLVDPHLMGLTGEYYRGMSFQARVFSRIDPQVDFNWGNNRPAASMPEDQFSVRWTGQISPRYTEKYTFYVNVDNGARLYVDNMLIIDQWVDQPPKEYSSVKFPISLEAGRWYAIRLEYFENRGWASVQLSWESRSQRKQIIPQERLYAVRDEGAQLELGALESQAGDILIGQSVVGESGPLEKADFGMPLYSDTAHLFTVSVPACALPKDAQRQMLRRIIHLEKPAHTDYQLCFVEPRMRVGYQARLGIDSIVAGPPPPLDLGWSQLGVDSHLADPPPEKKHKAKES